ncbi:DUF397 domain-containing protein [Streptomyces tateyamensis]|uniref:DUF397 domain-containing protein n=1 Tax=Streptomyces tateyamensis TaxID=565073 RepID=A0A2V4NQV4_9ACTN|nr:DUF397 domain-containing protein [Streptomyces tateyamensis]PYC88252.1 DUF397 domain-containing protein [Streptomyces tateyamensis]
MTVADVAWVKSSYSQTGGECIEWAPSEAARVGVVPVRDSKDAEGGMLAFGCGAWRAFVAEVRAGGLGVG